MSKSYITTSQSNVIQINDEDWEDASYSRKTRTLDRIRIEVALDDIKAWMFVGLAVILFVMITTVV